jgi:membrane protease YdiL (CAAX protease family)
MINKEKLKPLTASIILAIIFSLIHFVFYKWIFNDQGIIQFTALISLFLIGFVRNNLIIQTGHIGYSWALHFGWMVVMFGSTHIYNNGIKLSEPERFNIYLGSVSMVIISVILALISLAFWIKKKD